MGRKERKGREMRERERDRQADSVKAQELKQVTTLSFVPSNHLPERTR
jgi:hypothetical protein